MGITLSFRGSRVGMEGVYIADNQLECEYSLSGGIALRLVCST